MYKKTVLENGVRIVSERVDHLKSLSLGIWVDAGSRDEGPGNNGISHFIEHMIFKGTTQRTSLEIAKEFDAIGGLSNAFTGKESTCFHARVLGKHFHALSDILSDIFLNSVFDSEEMEKERQVILQEISMVEDTPEENIHVLFTSLFWMDHPLGMPILGTQETVESITRNNILEYMKSHYKPHRILIVAAGDIDHDQLVEFFAPRFKVLDGSPQCLCRQPPSSNPGFLCVEKDLEQVHICLGGEAPSLQDPRRFSTAIFNTILGGNMSSRLFQEIREKRGLAYTVYSFLSAYIDTGLLGIYVATDPSRVIPVLETIYLEVSKVLRGEIGEADLEAAKEHLIGGLYLNADSTDSRMMRIAKNEMIFGRYISCEELAQGLERVSVEDVVEAANSIFQDGKVSIATLGPVSSEVIGNCQPYFKTGLRV